MEPLSSCSAHAEPMLMLSSCSAHAHAQLMLSSCSAHASKNAVALVYSVEIVTAAALAPRAFLRLLQVVFFHKKLSNFFATKANPPNNT